jgi:superfamily II DNA/RNA helicase
MMDEDYVHRIGRTGRNGASGQAVSFVSPEEMRVWRGLVRKYKIKCAELDFARVIEPRTGRNRGARNSSRQMIRYRQSQSNLLRSLNPGLIDSETSINGSSMKNKKLDL